MGWKAGCLSRSAVNRQGAETGSGRRTQTRRPGVLLLVVDVVARLRVGAFFKHGEGVHRAGQIGLELIPLGTLVAAGLFPLAHLTVVQRVELDTILAQL